MSREVALAQLRAGVISEMVNRGVHPILIIDGDRLVGFVSHDDLVAALLGANGGRALGETQC